MLGVQTPVRGSLALPVFGRRDGSPVPPGALPLPGGQWYAFVDVPEVRAPQTVRVGPVELRCEPPPPPGPVDAEVVVCMATFRPPPQLLERQLQSLRDQTLTGWRCVISHDGPPDARLRELVAGDDRFVLVDGPGAGFYRNFEHALAQVGAARYVALADQDDRWHPDKLATLKAALDRSRAAIAYSDARIVDPEGRVLAGSFYSPRRNNPDDLRALLLANTAPGAAMLIRRDLLERALPFPVPFGTAFHDHWLALLARVTDGLEFVDRPLWDYVQHGANVAGHSSAQEQRRRGWRGRYARVFRDDLLRLLSLAGTLELRTADALGAADRATVRRLREIEHDRRAQAALLAHGLRARRHPEAAPTAAIELDLALALAWRRAFA